MARGALIYRADIQLADEDRGIWLQETFQLALHPSETPVRMVARLLAWCLLPEPEMRFTRGLSTREEPDLWQLDDSGHVRHWVEVGEPDPDRLRQALNRADRVTVVSYAPAPNQWWQKHRSRLEKLDGLHLYSIDARHLTPLTSGLPRSFTWQVSVEGDALHVFDHENNAHDVPVTTLI